MNARNQVPALWLILYLGCVLEGFALAALRLPLPEAFAGLISTMFALLVVLGSVVIGLAVWRLSLVVTVAGATWRWVLLTVLVLLAMGAWLFAPLVQPEPSDSSALVLFVLGLGVVLSVLISFAMNTLVKVVAGNRGGVSQPR